MSVGVWTDLEEVQKMESIATDNTLVNESEMIIATEEPIEARVEVVATGDPHMGEGELIKAVDTPSVGLKDPST